MKTRVFMMLVALAAIFVVGAIAADVNGKWTAEVPGRDGQTRTQTFNLKADGDKLTGTVTMMDRDVPISDGKITGDDISFVVKVERNGNEMKMNYTGKVVGNELKMKRETQRGAQEFTAKRVIS
jgi:hypothetical protein